MRPAPPTRIVRDTRTSSSDCDDSRREPRGSSRMRWSPCGSTTCAVLAHGLPLKICRLAATTRPVRGTSTVPMARSACGRSFASRPRALVRSLGSRPNGRFGSATLLLCAPAAVVPLEACSPTALENVYEPNACQPFDAAFLHGHHEAVVRHRVAVGIRQPKPASSGTVEELEHGYGGAVGQLLRALTILTADVGPADEVGAILADVGDGHCEPATDLAIHANGILVGMGCAYS